jgi:hypothetical protein
MADQITMTIEQALCVEPGAPLAQLIAALRVLDTTSTEEARVKAQQLRQAQPVEIYLGC